MVRYIRIYSNKHNMLLNETKEKEHVLWFVVNDNGLAEYSIICGFFFHGIIFFEKIIVSLYINYRMDLCFMSFFFNWQLYFFELILSNQLVSGNIFLILILLFAVAVYSKYKKYSTFNTLTVPVIEQFFIRPNNFYFSHWLFRN